MTWKGEKRRHSLASRGIKTNINNKNVRNSLYYITPAEMHSHKGFADIAKRIQEHVKKYYPELEFSSCDMSGTYFFVQQFDEDEEIIITATPFYNSSDEIPIEIDIQDPKDGHPYHYDNDVVELTREMITIDEYVAVISYKMHEEHRKFNLDDNFENINMREESIPVQHNHTDGSCPLCGNKNIGD